VKEGAKEQKKKELVPLILRKGLKKLLIFRREGGEVPHHHAEESGKGRAVGSHLG